MVCRYLLSLVFIIILTVFAAAQTPAPTVDARVTTESAEIGGNTTIELKFDRPLADISVKLPSEQQHLLLLGAPKRNGDVWEISVTPLVSGEHELGPLTIQADTEMGEKLSLEAGPVKLNVAAPAIEAAPPAEYAPVMQAPPNWTLITLIAAGSLLLLLILGYIAVLVIRKLKTTQPVVAPSAPVLSPIEEAFAALGQLKSLDVFRARGTKAHYSELSMLVRRYLERQEKIPALEMTEDEVVSYLRRGSNSSMADQLAEVFNNSSSAKFAKWQADDKVARGDVETIERYLEGEKLRLQRTTAAKEAA